MPPAELTVLVPIRKNGEVHLRSVLRTIGGGRIKHGVGHWMPPSAPQRTMRRHGARTLSRTDLFERRVAAPLCRR
jgi:hypothetical protein